MKFCLTWLIVCLLTIATPVAANATPNDSPVLSATASADGTTVTVTGSVVDESPETVKIFVFGGASASEEVYAKKDGTFSITLDVPPFATELEIEALDNLNKTDYLTIEL